MPKTRILIAPNAFKHSLGATDVALAIQEGLYNSRLDCACECFPVGDGGDGTGDLMIQKLEGERISVEVNDPFDRLITSSFGLVHNGETAIVELASASGIRLVRNDELNPVKATSFGTGELMKRALDQGVKKVVLAIGGSATVDGGTGILRALGIRFLDAFENELIFPEDFIHLTKIDMSGLDPHALTCAIVILCDVDNTLLGEQGSAAVFGPQKGATPEEIIRLDASLANLARVAQQQTGVDMAIVRHGGAAGGVAAGLYALLNAQLINGIDFFLEFTDFAKAVAAADIVVTGEGSLDEQTLHGKGPFGVARQAKTRQLPVIGIAGKIPIEHDDTMQSYFDILLAVGNEPADLDTALKNTKQNLTRIAFQIGNLLAINAC